MRPGAAAALVLAVLALQGAQAGGVHDGPEPTPTDMFIHFAGEDVLPADPVRPAGQSLPPAPESTLCEEPLRWIAASNRAPYAYDGGAVTWAPGLLRDAVLAPERAPTLTWFLETVAPGTADPADIPATQVVVEATLRLGDTPATLGKGAVLADGSTEPVLLHSLGGATDAGVEGRHVYAFELRLDWQADAVVPAQDGFHIEIVARQDVDGCEGAPAGVRAYSGPGTRPTLAWDVFDPVRIDLLEARPRAQGTDVVLHASSPWGVFDVLLGDASLRGPAGDAALPEPQGLDVPGLGLGWALDDGTLGNGTYRIDADVRNIQDSATAQASAVFRIGDTSAPAPPAGPTEAPGKDTPVPPGLVVAALAWALLRRR